MLTTRRLFAGYGAREMRVKTGNAAVHTDRLGISGGDVSRCHPLVFSTHWKQKALKGPARSRSDGPPRTQWLPLNSQEVGTTRWQLW